MTLGRPIPPLQLSQEERETLERWVRRPSSVQALSLRARIILICAQGKTNTEGAQQMRLAKPGVGRWRSRFVARRLDGLLDEPRPGAADPTFRLISSQRMWDRGAALTSTLHLFETELLTKEENLIGLMALNRRRWGRPSSWIVPTASCSTWTP